MVKVCVQAEHLGILHGKIASVDLGRTRETCNVKS